MTNKSNLSPSGVEGGKMLEQISDERIYEKFVANSGEIEIGETEIRIDLKKKRELPLLPDFFKQSQTTKYPWLKNKYVLFHATSTS